MDVAVDEQGALTSHVCDCAQDKPASNGFLPMCQKESVGSMRLFCMSLCSNCDKIARSLVDLTAQAVERQASVDYL